MGLGARKQKPVPFVWWQIPPQRDSRFAWTLAMPSSHPALFFHSWNSQSQILQPQCFSIKASVIERRILYSQHKEITTQKIFWPRVSWLVLKKALWDTHLVITLPTGKCLLAMQWVFCESLHPQCFQLQAMLLWRSQLSEPWNFAPVKRG